MLKNMLVILLRNMLTLLLRSLLLRNMLKLLLRSLLTTKQLLRVLVELLPRPSLKMQACPRQQKTKTPNTQRLVNLLFRATPLLMLLIVRNIK
jgi:hypothetical protein